MKQRRDGGVAAAVEELTRSSGRLQPDSGINPRRAPGRPMGKRADPDYRQRSVWLRRTTHRAAMAKLRAQDPDSAGDFSELVEELVGAWAKRPA